MTSLLAEHLANMAAATLNRLVSEIEDLTTDELHATPFADGNTIGFDAWHIARTFDNLVHFAFYRDQPVWLQQGLDEAWGLPRTAQGTGIPGAEARAMRFPEPQLLAGYVRAVRDAVTERIRAMDDDFLLGTSPARVMGAVTERQRAETIETVMITHGNQHIGQIDVMRQLLGRPGIGV